MSEWKPIRTFRKRDYSEVDVWMNVPASPLTMGWGDAFRVTEAYRIGGKWYHRHNGEQKELRSEYVTHWMPIPAPPSPSHKESNDGNH